MVVRNKNSGVISEKRKNKATYRVRDANASKKEIITKSIR